MSAISDKELKELRDWNEYRESYMHMSRLSLKAIKEIERLREALKDTEAELQLVKDELHHAKIERDLNT